MSTNATKPVAVGALPSNTNKRRRVRKASESNGGKSECSKAVAAEEAAAAAVATTDLPHKPRSGAGAATKGAGETKAREEGGEGKECPHCGVSVAEEQHADHLKYEGKRTPQFLCKGLQAKTANGAHCGLCFKPRASNHQLGKHGKSIVKGRVRLFEVDGWDEEFVFPKYICLACAHKRGFGVCCYEYPGIDVMFGCCKVSNEFYGDQESGPIDSDTLDNFAHCEEHYQPCGDCENDDGTYIEEGICVCDDCGGRVCMDHQPEHEESCHQSCNDADSDDE